MAERALAEQRLRGRWHGREALSGGRGWAVGERPPSREGGAQESPRISLLKGLCLLATFTPCVGVDPELLLSMVVVREVTQFPAHLKTHLLGLASHFR